MTQTLEPTTSTKDQALIDAAVARFEGAAAGDEQAFADMVQAESPWVRALVYSMVHDTHVTDDVVQHAWMQVARKSHQCSDSRRWRSWVYQIARRAALDAIAANKRRSAASLDESIGIHDRSNAAAPADSQLEQAEELDRVLKAVRSLPVIYREPLVLRALHGWDYERISEVLDMPVPTVETRLVRARRLLRELLATQEAAQERVA